MRAALFLASVLVLAACGSADAQRGEAGSGGNAGQRSYQLSGFNSVSLSGSQDVIVQVGPDFSVRAEGDSEMLDRLDLKVKGESLQIGMKQGNWLDFRNRSKTTIHVTLPMIVAASVAGSGDMRIDRAEGDSFSAAVAGSGDLDVGALRVGQASFSIAGSGGIRASGAAGRASTSVAGSGDIDASRLEAQTASIAIVGSGDVRARVMRQADVSITGSGDVTISGPARCSVSKRGSGSVQCEERSS